MSLPLIPQDKANHIVYGSVIFVASYLLFGFAGLPPLPVAGVMVVIAALAKAIQEQQVLITEQQTLITNLTARVAALEA